MARGDARPSIDVVEGRPKSIDSPRRLTVDARGKVHPAIEPNQVDEQLRAWVVEHVSFRNFAPKLDYAHPPVELKISPQTLERLRQKGLMPEQTPQGVVEDTLLGVGREGRVDRAGQSEHTKAKFAAFIEKHFDDIGKEKQEELLRDAARLYEVSRDEVAPVVLDFAGWCLEKVAPGQTVLFLARDGLAPWIAARLLVRQGRFPGISEEQLKYAQLSRKIMWEESRETIRDYLSQIGVENDGGDLLMVDIGMYGAIHSSLQNLYPQKKAKSLFLISASNQEGIEGYLSDVKKKSKFDDPLWKNISGNPAVHFLEDTFSGFYSSTQGLERTEGGAIQPQLGAPYSREVYLKRLAAVWGVADYALAQEGGDPAKNSAGLSAYLTSQFQEDKKHIMVPHES